MNIWHGLPWGQVLSQALSWKHCNHAESSCIHGPKRISTQGGRQKEGNAGWNDAKPHRVHADVQNQLQHFVK